MGSYIEFNIKIGQLNCHPDGALHEHNVASQNMSAFQDTTSKKPLCI